jgi:hypothetical protein
MMLICAPRHMGRLTHPCASSGERSFRTVSACTRQSPRLLARACFYGLRSGGSVHGRTSVPCCRYPARANTLGISPGRASTDRDQVDLYLCMGEHPSRAADILPGQKRGRRLLAGNPQTRSVSHPGGLLRIAIRWICAPAGFRARLPTSSPCKTRMPPLAGNPQTRSASHPGGLLRIAIRWICARADFRSIGRISSPAKNRMAVPSPAAAALPRISGLLHDSADPQPDVAAHPSPTGDVGKVAKVDGCHRDIRSRTGSEDGERQDASGPW